MPSLVRRVLALVVVAVLAVVAVVVLFGDDAGRPPLAPGAGARRRPARLHARRARTSSPPRPRAATRTSCTPSARRRARERRSAPRATARSSRQAAQTAGVEPDTLEAMVLLESAGRDDAIADPQLEGAVGLTQILAETGRNLLRHDGRHGGRAAHRALAARAPRARATRRSSRACGSAAAPSTSASTRPRRWRRPRATCRSRASELGREDLAVVSYHMGIGNLQSALRAYGEDDDLLRAAVLRLDAARATPRRYAQAGGARRRLLDVPVARRARRARSCACTARTPAQLDRVSRAAERARTPPRRCCTRSTARERFATPVRPARRLRRRPDRARCRAPGSPTHGLRIDPRHGRARRPARAPAHDLPRPARAGARAARLPRRGRQGDLRASEPLVVTSSVRDERYQRLLVARNREATRNFSLHTTGWAFDILRSYRSRARRWRSSSCSSACRRWTSSRGCASRRAIHVTVRRTPSARRAHRRRLTLRLGSRPERSSSASAKPGSCGDVSASPRASSGRRRSTARRWSAGRPAPVRRRVDEPQLRQASARRTRRGCSRPARPDAATRSVARPPDADASEPNPAGRAPAGDVLGGDAELAQDGVARRRGAEAVDRDDARRRSAPSPCGCPPRRRPSAGRPAAPTRW